ncbi:MAG: hypothetical protein AAB958_01800 [Patescibacteria group bacterium]
MQRDIKTLSKLKDRILKAAPQITEAVNSLPEKTKPCLFVGFGSGRPAKRNSAVLLGWSYDWSDKGDDPPPWSDWGDKTE